MNKAIVINSFGTGTGVVANGASWKIEATTAEDGAITLEATDTLWLDLYAKLTTHLDHAGLLSNSKR